MNTSTDALIRRLAQDVEPVQPLPHPLVRTVVWLALAVSSVAVAICLLWPRWGLHAIPSDLAFAIEQSAAFATGVTAAAAAFVSVVPGYKRKFLLLPALPIAAWLGTIGRGCVQDWLQFGSDGLPLQSDWICLRMIALMGAVPAIAMVLMLRRGAPLRPKVSMAFGGLAAAGLGNFGLRLVHVQEASLMVLVWQCGAVFALSALAGWAGPWVLSWRSVVNGGRRDAVVQ